MKLPSVYANEIKNDLKNNGEYFHADRQTVKKDLNELKNQFDNRGYANKLRVILTLRDGRKVEEKLVLCQKDCFVNLYNQRINFADIVDYEIKK